MADGERPPQRRPHERQHRDIRANPENEGADNRERKDSISPETSPRILKVFDHMFEPSETPFLACTLLDAREIPELPPRRVSRGLWRQTRIAVGRFEPLQMGAHLLRHLGFEGGV